MSSTLLWFFVSLWTLSSGASAGATTATADCSSVIPSVMSCLGYVSDGSTNNKPTKDCCVGIGGVIKNTPDCLCEALKLAPTMGSLNMTRILGLPDACSLKMPDLECIKNATAPPAPVPAPPMPSPTPSPAPAPTPSPSPAPSLAPPKAAPAPSPQPSVQSPPPAPAVQPTPDEPVDAPAPAPSAASTSRGAATFATCMALAASTAIVLSGLMS